MYFITQCSAKSIVPLPGVIPFRLSKHFEATNIHRPLAQDEFNVFQNFIQENLEMCFFFYNLCALIALPKI